MASPNGETLSKDKATPFVVNYEMVDTDKTAKYPRLSLRLAVARDGFKRRIPQPSKR
jgi:hypothetical protein